MPNNDIIEVVRTGKFPDAPTVATAYISYHAFSFFFDSTSPMTDYIRRLVSGKKARFKDDELKLELGKCSSLYNLCCQSSLHLFLRIGCRPGVCNRPNHHYGVSGKRLRRLLQEQEGGCEEIPGPPA